MWLKQTKSNKKLSKPANSSLYGLVSSALHHLTRSTVATVCLDNWDRSHVSLFVPWTHPRKSFLFSQNSNKTTTWGKSVSLVIHLVHNGDMKAERRVARLPAWLDRQSAFVLPGDFMPGGRQNCSGIEAWREPVLKHRWCRYCIAFSPLTWKSLYSRTSRWTYASSWAVEKNTILQSIEWISVTLHVDGNENLYSLL